MKHVISIVEDERDLNFLVKGYLEKEGYEVHSYFNFDEAAAHVSDENISLWILDIMLGDKSGFDLIELIRNQYPTMPVIFMSARDKEFDRIIGLEKGSDDYITKPFSPKELVLRDEMIDLTTKEFELLMLFVKNIGQAFSRDQILVKVWDENYYGSDRVVDDTLRRLRKKCPELNIQTIYGFGYRLG